jgi:hypothetical protein
LAAGGITESSPNAAQKENTARHQNEEKCRREERTFDFANEFGLTLEASNVIENLENVRERKVGLDAVALLVGLLLLLWRLRFATAECSSEITHCSSTLLTQSIGTAIHILPFSPCVISCGFSEMLDHFGAPKVLNSILCEHELVDIGRVWIVLLHKLDLLEKQLLNIVL